MEMRIRSKLVVKLRTERLWSQEQLAGACGLGLRTIQRLESSGKTSIESIRAIASALEIDADKLLQKAGFPRDYKHTQVGYFILISLGVAALLIITAFPQSTHNVFYAIAICSPIAILAILFCTLTIEVSETEVVWYFGPGFWRKRLSVEEIAECSRLQNPWWYGFGVRALGTGWLYNVSGLLAVELRLRSGATIRLGTDEPNYLLQAIDDARVNAL